MQTDRQDKCALGWDHQEKPQLHESQKGAFPRGLRSSALVTGSCALGFAVLGLHCVMSSLGGGEGPSAALSFEKTPLPVVIPWGVAVRPLCPGAPAAAAVSQGLLLPTRVAEGVALCSQPGGGLCPPGEWLPEPGSHPPQVAGAERGCRRAGDRPCVWHVSSTCAETRAPVCRHVSSACAETRAPVCSAGGTLEMELGVWHGSSQPAHRQVLACFRAVADPFRFLLSFSLLSPL